MTLHDVTRCYMTLHNVTWCYMMLHDATWCYMMLHDVTWCYTMLHDVTWCYMMLHDVARCCTMLHDVTRCYTMLHDVTRCYMMLHQCRFVRRADGSRSYKLYYFWISMLTRDPSSLLLYCMNSITRVYTYMYIYKYLYHLGHIRQQQIISMLDNFKIYNMNSKLQQKFNYIFYVILCSRDLDGLSLWQACLNAPCLYHALLKYSALFLWEHSERFLSWSFNKYDCIRYRDGSHSKKWLPDQFRETSSIEKRNLSLESDKVQRAMIKEHICILAV